MHAATMPPIAPVDKFDAAELRDSLLRSWSIKDVGALVVSNPEPGVGEGAAVGLNVPTTSFCASEAPKKSANRQAATQPSRIVIIAAQPPSAKSTYLVYRCTARSCLCAKNKRVTATGLGALTTCRQESERKQAAVAS